MPLRLRGVEVKPYIVNEAPVTGASLYDNGAGDAANLLI